ncbi:sensor domain-containing diguanylate cyclase [Lachnospiraceae bacterium]|jgi:diguanylate cyclase (GGDEF)-like protein|nr:sensor domain-containing diguanylate cyclase [Lachnospiraceae bacterium]
MQKTFIKYTFFILTTAVSLILGIHFLFGVHMLEEQQYDTFHAKIEQMIHTLESNREELRQLNESLDEDYLTRARAAEYVLDRMKSVSMDVSQMQYLADLLNVDELHVIDGNGIIVSASVSKYVGIDMADHEQTREFLTILESDDENAFLIQDTQPNAAENKIMKYVGVARKGQKGVVQVGFKPIRQLDAISRNTYSYIFSRFPTDIGEELYVIDQDGKVLGHSGGMENDFRAPCYQLEQLKDCEQGIHKEGQNGKHMYVVGRQYDGVLLCAALPRGILFQKLWKNILAVLAYLLFIEAAVILLLNYLVKRKVIDGIHYIIENLTAITNGNFDTVVAVGGNREFEKLSAGINMMVKSIVNLTDHISVIIENSGVPLAAFEYERGINYVFTTSGLSELLDLPPAKAAKIYKSSVLFDEYIQEITEKPIEGEEDIYQLGDKKYARIHMSKSAKGCLGVITDVTKDVMEKKRMQYENTHDALTGLYKFEYFKLLAEQMLQKMPPQKVCAAVMLDLDHFKSINDTYGHDGGDSYIQDFSNIMKSMPPEHFLCARRSGDEFCMMIHDCEDKAAIVRYLDIFYRELGQNKTRLSETHFERIRASAGFAWTDNPESSMTELLRHADEALYDMKNNTKGYYGEYTVNPDGVHNA